MYHLLNVLGFMFSDSSFLAFVFVFLFQLQFLCYIHICFLVPAVSVDSQAL